MSQVMSFKMITGEEVVAELLQSSGLLTAQSTPTTYVLKRPHILQFQPMGNGQLGLAFIPWTLSNPTLDSIEVPTSAVVVSFSPSDTVERQYLQQTSGIAIATPGSRIST